MFCGETIINYWVLQVFFFKVNGTAVIDIIKIDRSFIKSLDNNTSDQTLVKAIISMGKNLGLKVVAEGVETAEQEECLKELNCDQIQGYYYSKPITPDELMSFIDNKKIAKLN